MSFPARSFDVAKASFSRPSDTNTYATGDLVANSTATASVAALSFAGVSPIPTGGAAQVRRVRINKSGTTVTNASFRVHLFNAAPVAAVGDNGAWSSTGAANHVGSVDVTVGTAFSDGATGQTTTEINTHAGTLYGALEARAAYVPANAETFTVTVEVAQK